MNEGSVVKVFSIKDGNRHYYVQEMPGPWGMGRDWAVMKDRRRLYQQRFRSKKDAVCWLLGYVQREYENVTMLDL